MIICWEQRGRHDELSASETQDSWSVLLKVLRWVTGKTWRIWGQKCFFYLKPFSGSFCSLVLDHFLWIRLPGRGEWSSKSQFSCLGRRIKGHQKENTCHTTRVFKRDNEKFIWHPEFQVPAPLALHCVSLLRGLETENSWEVWSRKHWTHARDYHAWHMGREDLVSFTFRKSLLSSLLFWENEKQSRFF